MCTIFRKLTIVCYERVHKIFLEIWTNGSLTPTNLLEKKIITDNCLLRKKDNILNLLER